MARKAPKLFEKFRSGERFLWGRFLGAVAHLFAIAAVIVASSVYYPLKARDQVQGNAASEETLRLRQLLLEALDYYVRYEHYHREVYGRYTRELAALGVPHELSQGTLPEIGRHYEIAVLEANPKRLLILASAKASVPTGLGLRGDRVTIDENYRLNGNFQLPHLSKKYLAGEADRVMQLRLRKRQAEIGLAKDYWRFEPRYDGERAKWVALGERGPVVGGQRSAVFGGQVGFGAPAGGEDARGLASIFSQVKRHLSKQIPGRLKKSRSEAAGRRELSTSDLHFLLSDSRFAQHVHQRERGFYAADWDQLDTVSSFAVAERVASSSNLELEPIEITDEGYNLRIKATSGALVGELFSMNEDGELKQIRYTDVLVKELNQSSGILQNSLGFQISEVTQDDAAITETKTTKKIKRGPSAEVP